MALQRRWGYYPSGGWVSLYRPPDPVPDRTSLTSAPNGSGPGGSPLQGRPAPRADASSALCLLPLAETLLPPSAAERGLGLVVLELDGTAGLPIAPVPIEEVSILSF